MEALRIALSAVLQLVHDIKDLKTSALFFQYFKSKNTADNE
jgi:hypothetical protein